MRIDRKLLSASWQSWFSTSAQPVGPQWLQWVWALLFSAVVAFGFTILGFFAWGQGNGAWRNIHGWLHWYGINLIISLSVGVTIRLLFVIVLPLVGRARIARFNPVQRALFFTSIPIAGTFIGGPPGFWLSGYGDSVRLDLTNPNTVAGSVLMSVLISSIFFFIFNAKARQVQAERRAAEARLRLLQGQIEPHFLFNTLANVLSLIDHDAPRAKQMLGSFTDYLRSSLGSLRHEQATLGSELDLAHAYLCLLKVRMEDRLQFSIDNDPALRDARLPPLLLQPLVENAIHHGLEPKVEGGTVRVQARAEGGTLVVTVCDDGLGLDVPPRRRGAGMALANLRERLLAQHGNEASLELRAAEPGHTGTRATLRLPLQR